jgi:hypothetical protein
MTEKKKIDWVLLDETSSVNIDRLFEIYKENPYNARIVYYNDKTKYIRNRLVMFNNSGNDFEVAFFKKTYGISVTNRIYNHEKKVSSIIYKGGKFYISGPHKRFAQLTYNGFILFVSTWSLFDNIPNHIISKIFLEKFGWLRNVMENKILHNISFNTIVKNKLFNLNTSIRYILKVPAKVGTLLLTAYKNQYQISDFIKIWTEMRKVLINVENIKIEMLQNHCFMDACKMAATLDKKVNCSWSIKRLVSEHDTWSKQITFTVLNYEPLCNLKNRKVYESFADFSGYKLLRTNRELMAEGMLQNHCVSTYISSIDNGSCAIYHIDGYTLELQFNAYDSIFENEVKGLKLAQFRGLRNKSAPEDLTSRVLSVIKEFNLQLDSNDEIYKDTSMDILIENEMEMPF